MSRRINFPIGYKLALDEWETLDFAFALMTELWPQDETVETVMSDINTYETTAPEYVRFAVGTKTTDIILPVFAGGPGYIELHGDDPEFGTLSGLEVITSLVLFQDTGDDSTSLLVSAFPCFYQALELYDITFVMSAQGHVVVSTKCP
jgi:hypothetical protein